MAERIDTVVIRFHADGKVGCHAEYVDDTTTQRRTIAIHTQDFPALDKRRIEDIIGTVNSDLITAASKLSADNAALQAEVDALKGGA